MTALGDRLLLVLVAATALGAVLWWVVGFVRGEFEGTLRFVAMAAAILAYVAILAGLYVWFSSGESEEPAGTEGGQIEDEEEHPENQTAPGSDVEQESDDRRR